MCWNKEVSLFTFVVISLVSYNLFKRNLKNDRLLAFFILSYGTMQFFEFLIWLGIDTNTEILNYVGSILGCLLLYFHPLAIMLGMNFDKSYKKYHNNLYYKILFIISFMFLFYGIYNIYFYLKEKKTYNFISYPTKDNNNHLIWDFPSNYYIVILRSKIIN